jgi:tetratricopeptide (TPR) repeat protein
MRIQHSSRFWETLTTANPTYRAIGQRATAGLGFEDGLAVHGTRESACPEGNTSWVNDFYPEAYDTTRHAGQCSQRPRSLFFRLVGLWCEKRRDVMLDRAERAVGEGRTREAKHLATQSLTKNPDDVRALHIRARAYFSRGFYEEAYQDINRAVALTDSRDGYLIGFRGKIKRALWDSSAMIDIDQALQILKSNADAFADRADLPCDNYI